ncbi:MAG: DNA polymerase III subunit alpha [Planctomycetota bacterium]|nr:DNA polymerase III subunit alpha [Planctomycetota bacterium]
MGKPPFTHLHVHSDYSLLDGAVKVEDYVRFAKKDGMKAIALTDHGNLFGAIEFYKAARKVGINPIIGMETYVAPRSRHDRKVGPREAKSFHLTLLARNLAGYKNLVKLSSLAYLEGFYYKPRIDKEALAEHREGLMALSGCLQGEVCWNLSRGGLDDAVRAATSYREILGEDNYYIELMRHGMEAQQKAEEGLLEVARRLSLPLVGTNDIHYRTKEDHGAHEVLLCLSTGKVLEDSNRLRLYSEEFYFKGSDEMAALFADCPEAYENTHKIASRCDIQIPLDETHLPVFRTEDGREPIVLFREICEEGFRSRYPDASGEARERLVHEMEVIERLGFVSYFLIVWDFIRYARSHSIPVGPGRGSAAGSIVAYALEITDIDPLRYGLIFERFLNSERISLPDIDIDFCKNGRGRLIEYLRNKYGKDNVTQIITFGTLAARGVIRDVGRVLGMPLKQVDGIAKMIPEGLGTTLRGTLAKEPEVADLYKTDAKVKELFDTALRLEGLSRHASTHAAGVVLTDEPLVNFVPLYRNGDDISTQYPMESVERIGLLKIDILGLKTLTILDQAVAAIRESQGIEIDLRGLPEGDEGTYKLLQRGATSGIFQMESAGMRDLLIKLKPDCFEDIVALIALYRPGPLRSGMVATYVERKHGREEITFQHPLLEPILRDTNGVILYQEQVMRVAHVLGGFTLNEADSLRKAMGKKKPEIMAEFKQKFLDGCKGNQIGKRVAAGIFDLMEKFAGYGFNRSHSTAYAVVAYQTAYLKANYPTEFLAALITCSAENTDKVVEYLEVCRSLGIEVLPPDVNESEHAFRVVDGKIRYGLGAVKGVGQKAVETIVATRRSIGRFHTLHDYVENVDLRASNKAVMEALARCGGFDSLNVRRSQVLAASDTLISQGSRIQQDKRSGQMNMFGGQESAPSPLPDIPELGEAERLAAEKQSLGLYLSGHPLDRLQDQLAAHATPIQRIREMEQGASVTAAGLITTVRRINDRRGNPMAFVTIEDLGGTMEITAFSDAFTKHRQVLQADEIVLIRGTVNRAREEPTIILDTATRWEDAPALSLDIRLPLSDASPERVRQIRETLSAHPGTSRVRFHLIPDGRAMPLSIAVSEDLSVTISNRLLDSLGGMVGSGAVETRS